MAEFKLGRIRFVWKSIWATSTTYYKDDVVRYGGKTFICTAGHTAAADFYTDLNNNPTRWNQMTDGQDWKTNWAISTYYKVNDVVKYGGNLYIAKTGHTSAATLALGLEQDSGKWDLFLEGFEWSGDWSTLTRYQKNDVVKYGGITYVCNFGHTSAATAALGLEADQGKWDSFNRGLEYKGSWSAGGTKYKINDVVKNGAGTWIATANHNSSALFVTDLASWSKFADGIQFESTWSAITVYQPGDIVKYGGNQYIAKTNHSNSVPTAGNTNWDLFSGGFSFLGDWAIGTAYKVGEVVRLGGYNYVCVADNTGNTPPNVTYWSLLNTGFSWKGEWLNSTAYIVGDVVRFNANAYICVQSHTSNDDDSTTTGDAGKSPQSDSTGTYWNTLAVGSETAVLTTKGDLAYYNAGGPARLPVGTEGQILRVSADALPEWATLGNTDHVYYVAPHGTDQPAPTSGQTLDKPWKSIRYACEQIDNGARNPNAQRLLELNRVFIQREVSKWIDYQVANNLAPFTTSYDFDEYKCERDLGFTVDRLIWDIGHGGNLKILAAALANINALAGNSLYATGEENNGTGTYTRSAIESTKDVAAYNYMLTVINAVLNNTAPAANYQALRGDSSTAVVTQFIDTTLTAETGVYTTVTSLIGIITTALASQSTANLPARDVPNNLIYVKTGVYNETLPIIVPAETCILGDEVRSTTVQAAGSLVSIYDAKYSIGALGRLSSIVGDIVLGNTITKTSGNTLSQSQNWPFADTVAQTNVQQLVRTMYNCIDWGLGTMVNTTYTNPTGYNASYLIGYGDARSLLRENKEFLKAEIIAYISANYPAVKYSKTACKRDVGYIVDAMLYDLTYGGHQQILNAGLAYFDGNNSTTLMISASEVAATTASYSRLRTVMQQIVANTTVTRSTGNTAIQFQDTITLTNGSAASSFIGAGLDIVINILAGDSTTSTTPQINITQIATSNTFTSATHGLAVGDAIIPRVSTNGLVARRKYWVVGTVTSNTFQLAASYGGSVLATFTNGTGLDIDVETIDYPTATNAVSSTTALITAAQTLDAAKETVVQGVVDTLNAVAWNTDFSVDDTSLTTTQFRIYVGKSTIAQTYVSGGVVTKPDNTTLNISGFSYNQATGYAIVTTPTHGLSAGDIVNITNVTLSYAVSGSTYTFVFPSSTGIDGIAKIRYLETKCVRDVRLILESVMFDFMFNSNFQSIKAAYSYLRASAVDVFTGNQKTITRNALTNAKTLAKANVGGDTTAQARIETLMTLIDDILFGATNEGSVCQTELRALDYACLQLERNRSFLVNEISTWIGYTYKNTVTQTTVTTNVITVTDTSWMQRNMAVRFTGTTFGGINSGVTYYVQNVLSSTQFAIAAKLDATTAERVSLTTVSGSCVVSLYYNSALCQRDVGRYIDALKFDLKYPGNYKSRFAARYYINSVKGSQEEDMYYLRNGTGIRNQTMKGLYGDLTPENAYGTSRTTAGAYVSLDPGWGPADFRTWIIARSPYVQNNATFGYAAIGQKIDGSLHNGGNKSITSNDFTQLISDGIGAWVTNNARAELVSVFSYYSHIGYLSENGGRIRGTNGNNSYGKYGSVAEGYDATEVPNTAVIDNKFQFKATVSSVLGNGASIYRLLFDNAGSNYTAANWLVTGGGNGAIAVADEFRDDAVFQVRLLDNVDDSTSGPEALGNLGGYGYITYSNTAQAGGASSLTLAATDSQLSSAYIGMKVIITGGAGVGQYGLIATYNSGNKLATVIKESDGTAGWDHWVPGTTFVSPDASSTYIIEPALSFTSPSYSSTARTLPSLQYVDTAFTATVATYVGISGATSGFGTGATFNVTRKGTRYDTVILAAGTGYARLDTITLLGTSLGGTSTNNITLIITSVNTVTGAIQAIEASGFGQGGVFVALATGTQTCATSLDAITWTTRTTVLPSAAAWTAVASGVLTQDETMGSLVVGRSYTIKTLNDSAFTLIGAAQNIVGTTFVATGVGQGTGVATPNLARTVAVASGGTASAWSNDGGVTWTAGGALPTSGTWSSVAYGKTTAGVGTWVAVRTGSSATAYSINGGTTWLAGGSLPGGGLNWTDITYGKGYFVAVASGTAGAAYSLDGTTWTASTISSSSNWISVAYGNNRFVAVSNTSGQIASVSLDGINWTASTLPSTAVWTDISYGQGIFLAVSTTTAAATSEDGILWTARTTSVAANGFSASAFGNPNQSGIWALVQQGSAGTVASSILTGARAKARAYVADNKISAIRIVEPGSGYTSTPTMTITDPNVIYAAPFTVRTGKGALANPSWTNRGAGYTTASAEIDTGNGYADFYQDGSYIAVKRITQIPVAGSNVNFVGLDRSYKLVQVVSLVGSYDGSYSAFYQVSPQIKKIESLADNTALSTRIRYSQVRLTGHDFLNIGFGNFVTSNYPNDPLTGFNLVQANETVENNGGRVFFTSTDQDGNFRVGDLFTIEQSTGVATLNADAFNIAGLQELSLGTVTLGGGSATVTEFSTDPYFTADSDTVVPTQRAIKAYIASQIGGGGASLNVNSVTAGSIYIATNKITNITGGSIQMNATIDFRGGVTGYPMAFSYFLT